MHKAFYCVSIPDVSEETKTENEERREKRRDMNSLGLSWGDGLAESEGSLVASGGERRWKGRQEKCRKDRKAGVRNGKIVKKKSPKRELRNGVKVIHASSVECCLSRCDRNIQGNSTKKDGNIIIHYFINVQTHKCIATQLIFETMSSFGQRFIRTALILHTYFCTSFYISSFL